MKHCKYTTDVVDFKQPGRNRLDATLKYVLGKNGLDLYGLLPGACGVLRTAENPTFQTTAIRREAVKE